MTNTIFNGQTYINASNTALEFITGQMRSNGTLPVSYLVPQDDPLWGNRIGSQDNRSWAYDIGLALLVFTASGEYELCKRIMNRLVVVQGSDGSFDSSFDHSDGRLGQPQIRTE